LNKQNSPKKPKLPLPKWQRICLRLLGVALVLLALNFYVRGFYAFGNGDIEFGRSHSGVGVVSNRDLRLSLFLALAGVIIFGLSFPSNETPDNDDKGSS
jgi:hypothetical protein